MAVKVNEILRSKIVARNTLGIFLPFWVINTEF